MPVDNLPPVLDLKPLQHNPFLDGTVVYDNAGGVLVPRSAGSMVDPLGANPLTDSRPSRASTEALLDSAQKTTRSGVTANAAALRGYQTTGDFFNTKSFENALDSLSDTELNDFIDGAKSQAGRAAAEAAATAPRKAAQKMLRHGSQALGALGLAVDTYNVADAVLDPTNNPADEIGDVAGSLIGGALGAGLGPAGALGGSLLGGWIGRQLGNMLQGDGGRVDSEEPGESPFTGGQSPGVMYRFRVEHIVNDEVHFNPWYWYTAVGPIRSTGLPRNDNGCGSQLLDGNGDQITVAGSTKDGCTSRLKPVDVYRVDGEDDTGGDPPGEPTPIVTPPTYAPTAIDAPNLSPPPLDDPLPEPTGEPLPEPTGEPLPEPTGEPLPEPTTNAPLSPPPGGSGLDSPSTPGDLPAPGGGSGTDGQPDGIDPNPPESCCDRTALQIEQLLKDLDTIKQHFHTSGFATLNLPDCDETTPYLLPWQGSGLAGIYEALETLSEATNRLWDQIKCPPETTAAVPMAWDIKTTEHPQLIVLWAPAQGGSSRWSMHIPHPRANLSSSYGFSFPQYTKGPVSGALVLKDNTRVVVNGASETECKKVLSYVRGLIDPKSVVGAKEVFTKGGANFSVIPVKAVFIKAFEGHKNQSPLWSKNL